MTRIDDLREELRAQARESDDWELPALRHPRSVRRRTTPSWRGTLTVLAAAAAVVLGVTVAPALLGGDLRPEDEAPAADAPARLVQEDWEPPEASCLAMTPECLVPGQVRVDDPEGGTQELRRRALSTGDPGRTLLQEHRAEAGTQVPRLHLLVGLLPPAGGGAVTGEATVRLSVGGVEPVVATVDAGGDLRDAPLFALPARDDEPVVRAELLDAPAGSRLVLAQFARPVLREVGDWTVLSTRECDLEDDGCRVPERMRADGEVRRTATVTTSGTGPGMGVEASRGVNDLRWLWLDVMGTERAQRVRVDVDGHEPLTLTLARPLLLQAAPGTSPQEVFVSFVGERHDGQLVMADLTADQ